MSRKRFHVLKPLALAVHCGLLALPVASVSLAFSPVVHAQETAVQVAVPAGPLSESINRLAEQLGVAVVMDEARLVHHRSTGLQGSYGADEAFAALLSGSDFQARKTSEGFVIRPIERRNRSESSNDTIVLGPMVVTAAGFEQNLKDAPASISVVNREELEKQSYTSIVDAVKHIPGVYVTGGGQNQDISIRGMSSTYTLYMVDGRPISAGRAVNTNGADSGKQIAMPPLAMIERIEVIRGPMSSLYGSEAMGGVINIITRQATDAWHGSVRTEYTLSDNDISNDAHHSEMYVAGPLVEGLLGVRLTGSYTGVDESDFIGGGDSAASRPETKRRQGGAEFVLTPNDANRLTLGYTYSTQEATSTPGKSVASTTTGLPSTYRFDKKVYVLTHDGNYGNLMLNTYLQHDISDKVQAVPKDEKITTLNTQGTYFWGDHVITFGGQYKDETFVNEENGLLGQGGAPDLDGAVKSVDRWIGAVFTEIEWSVTDDFAITTGLRYNDDKLFGGHLSPRIYGVYHLTPAWTLKGGISTGYRQPTLAQATPGFGSRTGGGGSPNQDAFGNSIPRILALGNEELDPETSINYEVGFVFHDPDMGLETSLMVFQTDFKDKISENIICASPEGVDRDDWQNYGCPFGNNKYYQLRTGMNVDKAMMRGAELAATYDFTHSLRLSTSYTYTNSEQKSGEFKGEPLNKQPKHMLNALLDWQINHQFSAWLQGNYRSKTSDYLSRTSMAESTPGYGFIDIGVVYKLTDMVDLKAGLYNLANKEVTNDTYGVVLDGRRLTVGLTANF